MRLNPVYCYSRRTIASPKIAIPETAYTRRHGERVPRTGESVTYTGVRNESFIGVIIRWKFGLISIDVIAARLRIRKYSLYVISGFRTIGSNRIRYVVVKPLELYAMYTKRYFDRNSHRERPITVRVPDISGIFRMSRVRLVSIHWSTGDERVYCHCHGKVVSQIRHIKSGPDCGMR